MACAEKPAPDPFGTQGHDHQSCVATAIRLAQDVCRDRGTRLTPLRQRVLELIWRSHEPYGAYDILHKLNRDGRPAAPPTVYRALEFLLEQGLIHRIESRNAFVGCTDPRRPHTGQFLICERCGNAAELEDDRILDAVERSAAELGFRVERHTIELAGLCPGCQKASSGPNIADPSHAG